VHRGRVPGSSPSAWLDPSLSLSLGLFGTAVPLFRVRYRSGGGYYVTPPTVR
jgi:hypothetical protein